MTEDDPSNGYEAMASAFMEGRERSSVGVATVCTWSRALAPGAAILDLGRGSGMPIAQALVHDGFTVCGIDASPMLIAAFRRRFPRAPAACERVEASPFFGRTFDAAIAIGLIFLLPAGAQIDLIRRVGRVLNPGGQFLLMAPIQVGAWTDLLTGRESCSLGAAAYTAALADTGLSVVAEHVDEGDSHYYDARRVERGELL